MKESLLLQKVGEGNFGICWDLSMSKISVKREHMVSAVANLRTKRQIHIELIFIYIYLFPTQLTRSKIYPIKSFSLHKGNDKTKIKFV